MIILLLKFGRHLEAGIPGKDSSSASSYSPNGFAYIDVALRKAIKTESFACSKAPMIYTKMKPDRS